MTSLSPNAGFNTRKFLIRTTAAAMAVCLGAALAANASDGPATVRQSPDVGASLKPYTAQYITKTRGISLTLDRQLVRGDDNDYQLTNGGSKLIAGFRETSNFQVRNGRLIPESYVYQGTGLMNRRREVRFTPGADTVRSLYKDNWYDLPYTENTFDRMSQLEQVRLQLMASDNPTQTIIVTVADGKRIKDYQLDFVREETLDTPLGKVKTLHFERLHSDPDRKSDTWLAPQWDYMMVKSVHVDDGTPVEVNLTGASVEGVALGSD